ncbi:tRNA uridine-5-carboxymethylaminomethyl(34) synthesis GTPase MnmE [Sphingomonas sp. DT-51]|uniref:tRNA uridine-5-carboxymethylaminomethyl(34) synthesis GTPase MnmE n=1 Tax=Sphingomonas sp. DT-51 TaxID=3396165 RepID=UPI003F1BE630
MAGFDDTIFALSSGSPPAAIAVMRISGRRAFAAAEALGGPLPPPRNAVLRTLRDGAGRPLDRALVLTFPGPGSASGEDLVELHLHGGRAVVAAVQTALAMFGGLRLAMPGEFTRRALTHGRVDLTQAEGLADLLAAETEAQRRTALAASEGKLSATIRRWMATLDVAAARVEAAIDYDDDADVSVDDAILATGAVDVVREEMEAVLAQPSVERLRDGLLVVLAGPPNAGKSSLFNALLERDAAIVTPIAGTTRDVLEAQVVRAGMPFRLCDTAGLAVATNDPVEQAGIERAQDLITKADVILWLGEPEDAPERALTIRSKGDLIVASDRHELTVSTLWPDTITALWYRLNTAATDVMTLTSDVTLHARQRTAVSQVLRALEDVRGCGDILLVAEHLRVARVELAGLVGANATETMLDALFGRFCLGK